MGWYMAERQGARMSKITNDGLGLTRSGTGCFCCIPVCVCVYVCVCTRVATVGVKGLTIFFAFLQENVKQISRPWAQSFWLYFVIVKESNIAAKMYRQSFR